jgi:hypothetical protein
MHDINVVVGEQLGGTHQQEYQKDLQQYDVLQYHLDQTG